MNGKDVFDAVALCHVLKNSMSITSLNFTGCGLSVKSAEVLAETVKVSYLWCHNWLNFFTSIMLISCLRVLAILA